MGLRLVPEITEEEIPLRVWSAFNDEEFEQYKGYLLRLRTPTLATAISTKESVHFEQGLSSWTRLSKTNFWWDIDNDVMFGFKKEFMKRVGNYVASSLTYMNDRKNDR